MESFVAVVALVWISVVTLRDAAAAAFGRDGGALLRWASGRHDAPVPKVFKPLAIAAAWSVPILLGSFALVGVWYPVEKSADDALRCTRTPGAALTNCHLADDPARAQFLVKDIEPVDQVQRVRGAAGETLGALLPGADPFAWARNVAVFRGGGAEHRLAGHYSKQPDGPFLPWQPLLLLLPWLGASLAWGRKQRHDGASPPTSSVAVTLPVGVPSEPTRAPTTALPEQPPGTRYASRWAPLAVPLSMLLVAAPLVILAVLPASLFQARAAWRLSTGLVDDSVLVTGGAVATVATLVVLGVWARAVLGRRAGAVFVEVTRDNGAPRISWRRMGKWPSTRVSLFATRRVKGSLDSEPEFETVEVARGDDAAGVASEVPAGAVSTEIRVQLIDGTVATLKPRA